MKSVIFFAMFCACAALPQSYTPEVQAARQRFFHLYNKAAAATAPGRNIAVFPHHGGYYQTGNRFVHQQAQSPVHTPKWRGPLASTIPAGLPGSESQVRNTPEVEAAIADFTHAYNVAAARNNPAGFPIHISGTKYNVGLSVPTQHNTGHYTRTQHDTGHYNPYQHNSGQYIRTHHDTGHYNPALHTSGQFIHNTQPRWRGPLASNIPAGLSGLPEQVTDTPEVKAAKASFHRAFNQKLHETRW